MKRLQVIVVVVILAAAAVSGTWLYLETRPVGQTRPLTRLPQNVMVEVDRGIRFTEVRDDRVAWVLQADAVHYFQEEERISVDNPHVLIYPPGYGEVSLSGERGNFFHQSGEMEIRGSVRGRSDEGYALEAEWLHYSEAERTIRTEAAIKIKSEDVTISGRGLVFDIERERLTIPARVIIKAKSGSWSKG